METVTNIASAASRAVFGTPATSNAAGNESAGQEPVAGQLGDVKQGEPYDKGNLETETGDGKEPVAGEKGNVKKGEPFDMGNAGEFLELAVGNALGMIIITWSRFATRQRE